MNTHELKIFNTLMRQAPMTAQHYFLCAIENIDKEFGDGYAQEHPALLGAYIQTAALDYQAGVISATIQTIGADICTALGERAPSYE